MSVQRPMFTSHPSQNAINFPVDDRKLDDRTGINVASTSATGLLQASLTPPRSITGRFSPRPSPRRFRTREHRARSSMQQRLNHRTRQRDCQSLDLHRRDEFRVDHRWDVGVQSSAILRTDNVSQSRLHLFRNFGMAMR